MFETNKLSIVLTLELSCTLENQKSPIYEAYFIITALKLRGISER